MMSRVVHTELHSKTSVGEDGLTDAVFSAIRWLPTDVALLPVLAAAFPQESWSAAEADVQVFFWPRFQDRTEPDVVIVTPEQAVVIEAKAGAAFGELQLEREWDGLATYPPARMRRRFLLAITDDPLEPQRVLDFRSALQDAGTCAWLPWTAIGRLLREARTGMAAGLIRLIDDTLDFLRHRGVHMDYTGITPEDNWTVAAATRAATERVYPQIAALQSALLPRLKTEGIVWGDNQQRIIRSGSKSIDWSHQWGLNFLLLPFRDASWLPNNDPKLIALFDFSRARMCVGARAPWPVQPEEQEAVISALAKVDRWRAVVGAWDVAEHAPDVPAQALSVEHAKEQYEQSVRRTKGEASLWLYEITPIHDAPLEWITSTIVRSRDLVAATGLIDLGGGDGQHSQSLPLPTE